MIRIFSLVFVWFSVLSVYGQGRDVNKEFGLDTTKILTVQKQAFQALKKNNNQEAINLYSSTLDESRFYEYFWGVYKSSKNLSILYNRQNDVEKAIAYSEMAYEMALKMDKKTSMAISSYNLGIMYHNANRFGDAIEMYQKAYNYFGEIENKKGMQKNIRHAIGTIYTDLQLYDKAILEYKKARKLAIRDSATTSQQIYNAEIIYSYLKLSEYDSARVYMQKAEKLMPKLAKGGNIKYAQKLLLHNEIDFAINEKEYSLALKKADIFSQNFGQSNNSTREIIESNELYGDVYFAMENYQQSAEYYNKAYQKAIDENYTALDAAIFKQLASSYTAIKNNERATKFWEKYAIVRDSLHKAHRNNQVSYYSELLQNNIKDDEISDQQELIALQEEKLYKKNITYYIVISAILIIGLLLFGLLQYRNSKSKTKYNEQLKEKNQKILIAQNALKEALKVKTKFLNTITHELRTPLSVISSSIYFLKHKIGNQKDNLTTLDNTTEYLLGYVNNIIEINTFDKNDIFPIENNAIEISALTNILFGLGLKDLDSNMLQVIVAKNVPNVVNGDYIKTSQILMNTTDCLLDCFSNGSLQLDIDLHSKVQQLLYLSFVFKITSKQIQENDLKNIITYLTSSGTQIENTTDVRLKIIKKHLQLLPANFESYNYNDATHELTLRIGFTDFHVNKPNLLLESDKKKTEILLVEDNKIIQATTQKILKKLNYNCTLASDGKEAVALCLEKKFDIILMDIMMPTMDGFTASRKIRSIDKNLRIVAVTAMAISENRGRFDEAGIKHILCKPVSVDMLNEKIKTVLAS